MANAINWFEIPVVDMDRAARFYSQIFEAEITPTEMMGGLYAFFPAQDGVGGALAAGDGYAPSQSGTLAYLNAGEDLSHVLNRVEAAGGQVTLPKTSIGENGYIAFFTDSEGNKVALHSMG